ncbi:MAG: aldehyde dehydrogenase [Acholeplasmatales bacterium]|nr:MAG: aldehyde dehydrogenase [Acholeplasmatales bacterium]
MQDLIAAQRAYFLQGATRPYSARIKALQALYDGIIAHQSLIEDALKQDLNKSSFEAYATEVGFCLHSIRQTMKHLRKWMRKKKIKTPFYHLFTRSYTRFEPLGQVLIIGPYNYPFQLVIEPLIGALAAGNTVIVKPSEFPSATEKAVQTVLEHVFQPEMVAVVIGGVEVTTALLKERFDHIFFTGSTRVGKIVYEAAAKHLTPVTLELGGKSPAIIDKDVKMNVAARRIAFGKWINAGQTCVAPDYLLVHRDVETTLIDALTETLKTFYPHDTEDFGHIINHQHFNRLNQLIDPEKVAYQGKVLADKRLMGPIILRDVDWNDAVMQEEIFGPILPIIPYDRIEDVLEILKTKEKPLALYVFSQNKQFSQAIFDTLSFGGGAINDTITQVANWYLPFGGVGSSGIGSYHGHASFATFSHKKAWVRKGTRLDPKLIYPPYGKKEKLIRRILR